MRHGRLGPVQTVFFPIEYKTKIRVFCWLGECECGANNHDLNPIFMHNFALFLPKVGRKGVTHTNGETDIHASRVTHDDGGPVETGL